MEFKQEFLPLSSPEYGAKQIEVVYQELEELRRDYWKKITDIINKTKKDDQITTETNIKKHNFRLEELKRIDEEIPKKQIEIETRIYELLEIEQADELKEMFDKLKSDCDKIINEKRELINDFQKELNSLDHSYVYSLHGFKSDTVKIVKLMREQFNTLRNKMLVLIWNKDYFSDASNDIKNKLNSSPDEKKNCIEGEFLRDRSRMLSEYNKNIKDLMKKLETAEKEFAQFLTRNEDEKELENEKEAFKEESKFINKIIVMEKFFNILKENIEDFTYELKILLEKLEYRVEVREEKIIENNENKEQYTKRRNRMKERNSKAMEMYKNVDDAKRSENIALKLDFIRTTESFDDLKKKFRHFEIYDEEQFIKIYKMNFAESRNIAIKLLLADRTIRSQQLGIDVFDVNQEGFTLDDLQNMQVDSEESSVSKKSKGDGTKNKNDSNFKAHILSKIPFDRVKEVFSLIIQEAEFLVDLDIKEKYGHLPIEEKVNYYSECICKALQIKTESELNQLLDIFDKKSSHSKIKEIDENEMSQNDEESVKDDQDDEKSSNKLQIDPDKVLDYLKEFYEEKKKNSKNEGNYF